MAVAACVVEGGDDRLTVLPELGMNKYNVPNVPTPGICRGSCTSSMPTRDAFATGRGTIARLDSPGGVASLVDETRRRLLTAWQLDEASTSVTLFPSGTDVEFLFLLLALGRAFSGGTGCVLSIITCAGEVGSGTTKACAGTHFSELLPDGGCAKVGSSIFSGGETVVDVRSKEVALRERTGALRVADDVDGEVQTLVEGALSSGTGCCIVHLVASCKTGQASPSLDVIERLRARFGPRVLVLVDGCQSRLRDGTIRRFLENGFGVAATGSKFYAGPPFSGAALMNAEMSRELNAYLSSNPLKDVVHQSALKSYVSAALVDDKFLPSLKTILPITEAIHRGVLLRWNLALAHIEDYHVIPELDRNTLVRAWATEVRALVSRISSPALAVLDEELCASASSAGLLAVNSIVGLHCKVCVGGQWRAATTEELRHAHRLMALDLSPQEPSGFAGCCFIAQPVQLGKDSAVLRVAIGAPQIISAHASRQAMVQSQSQEAVAVSWPSAHEDEAALRKLVALFENWDHWVAYKAVASQGDLVKYQFRKHWAHLGAEETLSISQLDALLQTLGVRFNHPELEALLKASSCVPAGADYVVRDSVGYERFLDYLLAA